MTQLFYGDCLEIIKNIPDSSVDMILTDPPYKIETSGGGIYKQGRKEYIKDIGQMSNGFPEEILNQCCRVKNMILNSSVKGDVIFDPFMGSGSTGVACINTDRQFVGIEIDERYFNVAKERIDKAVAENAAAFLNGENKEIK